MNNTARSLIPCTELFTSWTEERQLQQTQHCLSYMGAAGLVWMGEEMWSLKRAFSCKRLSNSGDTFWTKPGCTDVQTHENTTMTRWFKYIHTPRPGPPHPQLHPWAGTLTTKLQSCFALWTNLLKTRRPPPPNLHIMGTTTRQQSSFSSEQLSSRQNFETWCPLLQKENSHKLALLTA